MKKVYLLALSFTLVSLAPCFAQDEVSNSQPLKGILNKTEARIQSKLTTNYNKGLIDEAQLAEFQRDFDGILDHENELLTEGGLTDIGRKGLLHDLSTFEARLDKQSTSNDQTSTSK